ncbi:KDO2-lipid IV(A) lauroyltransferase [Abditibacterium utsteinense]|uniref:KDO2-lipid IV(A) lauroyltransferase n=1 Tax=Abditibacterium utsteinense TaxID=1960156 RepID=A0A2S8SSC6_9BACT|nr:lysophospholipid acyltransferase family protein [Abditibacterium utsteinense]PQV63678.1 KDO2-lipid IV(A) lauroyltransferase [Abditibacterium utsteinense]
MKNSKPTTPGSGGNNQAENSRDISGAEIVSTRLKEVSATRGALEARVAGALGSSLERASWAQCRYLGQLLGLTFFAVAKKRRELAIDNIQKALATNRAQSIRIARRSAQNWGMTTCEFLHSPGVSESELRDYVSLQGEEHLEHALAAGQGAILITAHFGNWELLTARLAQQHRVAGVVRPLSNATMQNHMLGVRRSQNIGLVSKNAAARPGLKLLKANGTLVILPDRHAGPNGILLPLFGRLTRFEDAPARLAMMSGAPILMMKGVRRAPWPSDGRIEGHISPGFHVESVSREERNAAAIDGTRKVMAGLEEMVRAHPDQWSWMLRRWREADWRKADTRAPSNNSESAQLP